MICLCNCILLKCVSSIYISLIKSYADDFNNLKCFQSYSNSFSVKEIIIMSLYFKNCLLLFKNFIE